MSAVDRVQERRRAAALARHYCDNEALSTAEIARRLGRAPATVKAYLYDPTGEKARGYKAKDRNGCARCGAPTAAKKTVTLCEGSLAGRPPRVCRSVSDFSERPRDDVWVLHRECAVGPRSSHRDPGRIGPGGAPGQLDALMVQVVALQAGLVGGGEHVACDVVPSRDRGLWQRGDRHPVIGAELLATGTKRVRRPAAMCR